MSRLLAQRSISYRTTGFASSPVRCITQDAQAVSSQSHHETKKPTRGHAGRGRQHPMNPGLNSILSKVDREKKTISTPVGDLPISPLLDPDYHETRIRWTKPKAPERTVFEKPKWRRHLDRNPWALALATPVRRCPGTTVCLPNFFLQDFNIILHPETGQPWYVPTSLAAPQRVPKSSKGQPSRPQQGEQTNSTHTAAATSQPTPPPPPAGKPVPARKPSGPAAYALARHDYLAQQTLNGEIYRHAYKRLMSLHHSSDRIRSVAGKAVWRDDMADLVLALMRRRAREDLAYLSALSADPARDPYLVRCRDWDEVRDDRYRGQRGCVLWLGSGPGSGPGPGPRATMDIPGVKFGRKIAVHDMWRLLGEDGVRKLREEVGLFREGEVFLVLRKRTLELQMKLWKLQGYLAHPFEPYLDPVTGLAREEEEAEVVADKDRGEEREWDGEEGMGEFEEEVDDVDEDAWEKQIQALRRMEAEDRHDGGRSSF